MNDTAVKVGGFFHPSSRIYRFTNLFFIASLSFGSYFAYDIVGAIAPTLVEELHAARGTVGSFFTMYSVAAVLAVLIGGMLTDKLGTRKASFLFSLLVLAGAVIVWQARSIPAFFLGRFIFGAGSEPLIVAQSAILARWFKNKELALSFGLTLTVARSPRRRPSRLARPPNPSPPWQSCSSSRPGCSSWMPPCKPTCPGSA